MLGVYAGFGWNGRKENGEEPIRPLQNFRPYIILTGLPSCSLFCLCVDRLPGIILQLPYV